MVSRSLTQKLRDAEAEIRALRNLGVANAETIERLKALERWPEWRSIETAPKDGTYILLGWVLEHGGGGTPEVAFWHGTHKKWCGRQLLNAEGYFSPTHWMPLPDADPRETKGDKSHE